MNPQPFTFGSLFTGAGGMDLGLEMAGMTCAWQVEVNPYARKILERHWPDVRRHGDVRTFPIGNPEDYRVDLIAGGDPCQENSLARSGSRTTQPSLGHEFIRVVEILRPRLVLRENPAKVRPDAPWPWWRFRSELERLGYIVLPFRLRACCVGADHQRDRLFLFAEMGHAHRVESGFCRRLEFAEGGHQAWDMDLWPDQPEPPRMADGVSDRVDRNRVLGNAVPPPVARKIGRMIREASR